MWTPTHGSSPPQATQWTSSSVVQETGTSLGDLDQMLALGVRLGVGDLVLDAAVDADDAPGLVAVDRRALADVPDRRGDREAALGVDVERVEDVLVVVGAAVVGGDRGALGEPAGPLPRPLGGDLLLAAARGDDRLHLVDQLLKRRIGHRRPSLSHTVVFLARRRRSFISRIRPARP